MEEILDVQLVCCILHKKKLIAALKPISAGEKLEFRAENSETVRDQIQRVLKTESCKIVEVNDENSTTRITVQKI